MTVAGTGMVDVTVPTEQSEVTESVISLWFKAVGDQVTEDPNGRPRGADVNARPPNLPVSFTSRSPNTPRPATRRP